MPRWIQEHNLLVIQLDLLNTNVYSNTSIPLFFSRISDPSMFKWLFTHLLRLFFIFMQLFLSYVISFPQKYANESRFSRIYMSNHNNIDIITRCDILSDSQWWIFAVVMIGLIFLNNIWTFPAHYYRLICWTFTMNYFNFSLFVLLQFFLLLLFLLFYSILFNLLLFLLLFLILRIPLLSDLIHSLIKIKILQLQSFDSLTLLQCKHIHNSINHFPLFFYN